MSHSDDHLLERVRAANPVAVDRLGSVATGEWGRELRAAILACGRAERARSGSSRRRRLIGPLAIAAAVVVAGGGALAAIALREPPAAVRHEITQALSLPAQNHDQYLPVTGGIREVITARTPYGEWRVIRTKTRGGLDLLTAQPVDPALAQRAGLGIGGCPAEVLPAGAASVAVCGSAAGIGGFPQLGLVLLGRTGPSVYGIEARYADGRVVQGYVQNGFFMLMLPTLPSGRGDVVPDRLQPLDASGHALQLNPQSVAEVEQWLGGAVAPTSTSPGIRPRPPR